MTRVAAYRRRHQLDADDEFDDGDAATGSTDAPLTPPPISKHQVVGDAAAAAVELPSASERVSRNAETAERPRRARARAAGSDEL